SDSASVTFDSAAPARIVNFALADYIEINNPEDLAAAEAGDRVNVTAGLPAFNGSGAFDDNSVYVRTDPLTGYRLVVPASAGSVKGGDSVTFRGVVKRDENGKYVEVAEITSAAAGPAPRAMGLTNTTLDTNVLVRVWGRVVAVNGDTFVIDNGSGGVIVIREKTTAPAIGSFAVVTGIASPSGVRAMEIL
ncbi:MAG: hypothetical protein J6X53_08085, partial [Abditibacteriota bacterium]|nr:hypothetical protein [Abditibacteriota bacterium]